jgi:hypothetical protein
MPVGDRARFADYLAAGMEHEFYIGYPECRFDCGIDRMLMGCRDLSDGTWLGPQGLAHDAREHDIILPEEFVEDALSKTTPIIPGWTEKCGPFALHEPFDLSCGEHRSESRR